MSADSDKIKVDSEGNFYKWREILKVEDKVQPDKNTPVGSAPISGHIPGIAITELLKAHVGKIVKITVEVKNES